jgi:curved DNA-binding protein
MSQNYLTYYQLLGVEKTATTEEISKAYKEKAKEYHPDKNDGHQTASKLFQYINDAKEVLLNKQKRKEYDDFISSNYKQINSKDNSSLNQNTSGANIAYIAIGAAVVGLLVGALISGSKGGKS